MWQYGTEFGKPWGVGIGPLFCAGYYQNGYLLDHYLRQQGNRDNELIFEFLWRDLDLKPKPVSDLPLTRYFGTLFGWMVARTGWDDNSVTVEMNNRRLQR